MRTTLSLGLLLLLLAMPARAELQFNTQELEFSEAQSSAHRFVYATIEVPEEGANSVKVADLRMTVGCPGALGSLTLAIASLWAGPPTDWDEALEPDLGITGLIFPAEGEQSFHVEIGKLIRDWTSGESATLVLAMECGDVDCTCSPLVVAGQLRVPLLAAEEQ